MKGRSSWTSSCARPAATRRRFELTTPEDYLRLHPTHQVATPAASSWGEGGYWRVWLNEKNEWIYPHLRVAQDRMTELARRFPQPDPLAGARAQAGRARTAARPGQRLAVHPAHRHQPGICTQRIQGHLANFSELHRQLLAGKLATEFVKSLEETNNLFPEIDYKHWVSKLP